MKHYIDEAEAKKDEGGVKPGIFRWLDPMNDAPLDTSNNQTVFSGKGWAIFVVDMEGQLYCGNHEEGKVHHSMFLAGGGTEQMIQFLKLFPQIPGSAIIRPDFFDVQDTTEPRFYRVKHFRFEGKKAKPLKRGEVVSAIPTGAMNAKVSAVVGQISV